MIFSTNKTFVSYWLLFSISCLFSVLISDALWASALSDEPKQEQTQPWDANKLIELINAETKEELTEFIQQATKADINRSLYDASLLSHVIELDDKALVALLLEKGANPEGIENETFPLMRALVNEQWEIVHLLLAADANPSKILITSYSFYGINTSPLLYTALQNKEDNPFVEMAIAFKPKLVYTKEMKSKPSYLKLALENNLSADVIRYFLAQGEELNKKTDGDQGTLYEYFLQHIINHPLEPEKKAQITHRQSVLNVLLDHTINITPSSQGGMHCYDPLYGVQSNLKTLNHLLEKGFDPNKGNCYQNTHLDVAAKLGDIAIFNALLDAGGIITNITIQTIIASNDDDSDNLLQWLWQNKPDIFRQCQASECSQYIQDFISNDKTNDKTSDAVLPIIDAVITALSDNTALLDQLHLIAVNQNNRTFADRLIAMGANPDAETATIAWLVAHNINPFAGKTPLHKRAKLEHMPANKMADLLKMTPKIARNKKMLNHWLILLLNPLKNNHKINYVELQHYLTLFKQYHITINNVIDDKGNRYLPMLTEAVTNDTDTVNDDDLRYIWLLTQGGLLNAKNHNWDTDRLQSLIQNEMANIPKLINLLVTAGILAENPIIGLKSRSELNAEGIDEKRYACHYASVQAIWKVLQRELDVNDTSFPQQFRACITTDLTLVTNDIEAPSAKERELWFERNFPQINFDLLSLDPAKTSTDEATRLKVLLAAQLKKVNKLSLKKTQQTLSALMQVGGQLPDHALRTFILGTDLNKNDIPNFVAFIKQLVAAGADPTNLSYEGEGHYHLMEHLSLELTGQALYDDLYNTLSLTQKIHLWHAFPARFIASVNEGKIDPHNTTFMFLIEFLIFAHLVVFIALRNYFLQMNKASVTKAIIPTWQLQCFFWAGLVLFMIALFNVLYIDSLAYQLNNENMTSTKTFFWWFIPWSIWLATLVVVIVAQAIALMVLFKQTFIQKNYHALTFFASLLFFSWTLALPLCLGMLANKHEYLSFPLTLLF